jgi:hypothetical protein
MELKRRNRSREDNNSIPTMLELAAFVDPSGPYTDDVDNFGNLAANMLSGSRRLVTQAPSNEKERVFRQVAAAMAGAAEHKWITSEVMISRLKSIAEENGRLGFSPEQLEEVIAEATRRAASQQTGPVEAASRPALSRRSIDPARLVSDELEREMPLPLTRALPAPEVFPIEALGDILAPAAEAIQEIVQSPWAMCGQSVLAAATLAVQGLADVELPTGQVRPISSFFLTVAGSGERKSATDGLALDPIRSREAVLHEAYLAEMPGYINEKAAWEEARKKACSSNKGNLAAIRAALDRLGPEPAAPLHPLLMCQEPTFEGLCRALEVGQPSTTVAFSLGF